MSITRFHKRSQAGIRADGVAPPRRASAGERVNCKYCQWDIYFWLEAGKDASGVVELLQFIVYKMNYCVYYLVKLSIKSITNVRAEGWNWHQMCIIHGNVRKGQEY